MGVVHTYRQGGVALDLVRGGEDIDVITRVNDEPGVVVRLPRTLLLELVANAAASED